MDSMITIEVILNVAPRGTRRCIISVPVDEWEQAQRLPFDLRIDYIHRIANSELLRAQVRRVDVRVIG